MFNFFFYIYRAGMQKNSILNTDFGTIKYPGNVREVSLPLLRISQLTKSESSVISNCICAFCFLEGRSFTHH